MREGYKKTEVGVIPDDWDLKTIDDVVFINPESLNNATNKELLINYIDIESVKTGKILGTKDYTFGEAPSRARRIVKFDDVIVSTVRPNLKAVATVKENIENLVCSTGFAVLRNKDNLCSKFLYQYALSDIFTSQLVNKTVGSNYPAVNTSDIKGTYIIVPPLKEQEKIAEILSTVDSQIDDTEKLIEKSNELKKGLMKKLLTKGIGHSEFKKTEVGEIPFDWEIKTLESIASVIDSLHETPKYIDNGISMIRVVDINGGYIQTTKTVKVSDETYKKFTRKYTPRKGDIIMSRVGSYGLVSYLRDNNKVCLGQNIVVINTDINKKFLFYALSSQYIKNEIDKVTVGSSQKSLSLANIKKLHIVLPTSSEQVNISNILESIDKNIEEYINKLEELKYLKKGLMQQLLTGKIRVNNL